MAKYDVVLLDADMTLLDFRRAEREALARVLKQYGVEPDEAIRQNYEKINRALWEALARGEVDQDFLVVERFAALARAHGLRWDARAVNGAYLNALGEEGHLLEGAEELCRRLSEAGLTLALATNGLPAAQRGRWKGTGLDRYIPHIFISMELGASKPRPAFFERIFEALSLHDLRRVVMVGDGLDTDILGANRVGIDSIWYNPERQPLSGPARPTHTAADYDELAALILGTEAGIGS